MEPNPLILVWHGGLPWALDMNDNTMGYTTPRLPSAAVLEGRHWKHTHTLGSREGECGLVG